MVVMGLTGEALPDTADTIRGLPFPWADWDCDDFMTWPTWPLPPLSYGPRHPCLHPRAPVDGYSRPPKHPLPLVA